VTAAGTLRAGLPADQGRFVALALSRFLPPEEFELWHVELLYREAASAPLRLLGMVGDECLRVEDADAGALDRYAWVSLSLDGDDAQRLIALCRAVAVWLAGHEGSIRLAFLYRGGKFDPITGEHAPVEGEYGLYCSTFVLAMCKGVGVELLDRTTWTTTREMERDILWFLGQNRERLVERKDFDHLRRLSADRDCVVYHPLEVMAAAFESPISHGRAKELADELRAEYDALFPPVDW